MIANNIRPMHCCECSICRERPRGAVARFHRGVNRLVAAADERTRRLIAGLLAWRMGRGGVVAVARITGLHRNTVALGQQEIRHKRRLPEGRVRRSGAGRKRLEEKCPGP